MAGEFDERDLGAFLAGVAVGGLVGAGIALLYAPASGRRTRGKIRRAAEDLGEAAEEKVQYAVEDARRAAEDAKKAATEPGQKVAEGVRKGSEKLRR